MFYHKGKELILVDYGNKKMISGLLGGSILGLTAPKLLLIVGGSIVIVSASAWLIKLFWRPGQNIGDQ